MGRFVNMLDKGKALKEIHKFCTVDITFFGDADVVYIDTALGPFKRCVAGVPCYPCLY